jgi:outer membrane lipoprotein-sorting protein
MVVVAHAQPPGFKPVDNLTEFKIKFSDEGKKITAIRSNFIQEKNLSLLEEKIVSEGKFWYKKENKVRLEYQKPFRYLMMMNGDQMVIRDDQKESRISTHSNKLLQQINRIMVDCVNGSILENKDFTSRVFQNDKAYLLVMSPTSRSMKEFFQTIQVLVDKKDWTVTGITLTEPGGDNTVIRFSDKALNEKLDDSLFVP